MSFSTQDITRQWASLPASQIANGVNEALHTNSSLVVTAPPGAGKSTLLPLTILSSLGEGEKILMLEPRRLAARQIAERMAQMLGEQVGETVGYRVRFESRVSKRTRIEVLTEGILTRMIVDDATLDGVSVVIFDEFHERSINSDLALALTRQAQQIIRPDLKVVIMSATIDTSNICAALQAPLIESEGRMFPVELHYADKDTDPRDIAAAAASTTIEAYKKYEGDILVFLPGQAEIERCFELLSKSQHLTISPHQHLNTTTSQPITTSTSQHLTIHPLYGNLSPEDQRRAIAPSAPGERKIVIATPIAETSITIEGVRVVIDAGLCRQVVFDARTGLSHLETVRISMDMATQRMGRAGRVAEGVCYRLWTKASEHLMAEQRKPEIEEADLAPMVLDTAAFGESDAEALPWLTMPPRAGVFKAKELLTALGAIDKNGNITFIGKRMATLPCHPRIARMILATTNLTTSTPQGVHLSQVHQQHLTTSTSHHNNTSLACDIAALLEEKDPLSESGGTDLTLRLSALRAARRKKQLGRWQRIAKIAAEYRRMAHTDEDNRDPAPTEVGLLVAYAYPERIAHSTNSIVARRVDRTLAEHRRRLAAVLSRRRRTCKDECAGTEKAEPCGDNMEHSAVRGAAGGRPVGADTHRGADGFAHTHRLPFGCRSAGAERASAGVFRHGAHAVCRRRQATASYGTALAGFQASATDARPRQFLARHILRGAQGAETQIPEALLARKPAGGRGCERREKEMNS